jgi:hypothetical protein
MTFLQRSTKIFLLIHTRNVMYDTQIKKNQPIKNAQLFFLCPTRIQRASLQQKLSTPRLTEACLLAHRVRILDIGSLVDASHIDWWIKYGPPTNQHSSYYQSLLLRRVHRWKFVQYYTTNLSWTMSTSGQVTPMTGRGVMTDSYHPWYMCCTTSTRDNDT